VAHIEARAVSDKSDYLRSLTTETLPSVSVYKLREIADYIEKLEAGSRDLVRTFEKGVEARIERQVLIEQLLKLWKQM
jgi:hypothetical protein